MSGTPAHCGHCGAVFFARGYNFPNSIEVTLSNNRETCPRCGELADVVEGTFDFVGNTIKVRRAPPKTIKVLTALQEALRAAQAGKSTEEVLAPIKKQSPELANASETVIAKGGRPLLVLALLALLFRGCTLEATVDLNRLIDQMYAMATGLYPSSIDQQVRPAPSPNKKSAPKQSPEQQRKAVITCPRTHRPVPTGLSFTEFRFTKAQLVNKLVARCPECGGAHLWNKEDAYLIAV